MKNMDSYNFSGKKALIRVDFNVPLNDKYEVTDNTRIVASLPTIKKVLSGGGAVILMSHLGRPKNGYEDKFSLKHIVSEVEKLIGQPLKFAPDCIGVEAKELAESLKPEEVLILENLRFYASETKGDLDFTEQLAKLGDVYVNDAFGTAHRAHASTTIIAQFFPNDKMFGYLIEKEISSVSKVLREGNTLTTVVNPLPVVIASPSSSVICLNNSVNLTASGASTYSWSTGSSSSSILVTPSVTITYTVYGTNSNGCVNAATSSITVNGLPVVNAFSFSRYGLCRKHSFVKRGWSNFLYMEYWSCNSNNYS